MGKKLTAEEIGQQVIDEPNTGFDQCYKCQGIETQGAMSSLNENSDDFDLICNECFEINVHKKHCVKDACKYGQDDCPVADSPSKEPLKRIWKVPVCRVATAFRTIEVIAKTEQEAIDKAVDEAGDEEFGSGEAEYSATDGAY